MVKREITKIKENLLSLFSERKIELNKIFIFGSYVIKTKKKANDIDIIVVSKYFRNKDIFEKAKMTNGIHKEMVIKFKKPFDFIYYSDYEWEEGKSLIIDSVKKEGLQVYGE